MTTNYPIRVIFMGTPGFALPAFQALANNDKFEVIAAYTQPDRPVGKKQTLLPSAVKIFAQKQNIPVYQPADINNQTTIKQIKLLAPDIIVVVAYGMILPTAILNIPKYGCVNIHASLLPRWRGASPIAFAILNGDVETGVTYMLMDEKLDHGPILKQIKAPISSEDTLDTLSEKLAKLGTENLCQTLLDYVENVINPLPQDDSAATVAKSLTRDDAKIDWHEPAERVERKIRAFDPWPGTFCLWNDKRLKINKAKLGTDEPVLEPGEVRKIDERVLIGTGQGNLEISELQLEGKKPIQIKEFLNGFSDFNGARLI
ncbi:methionyl-tRNA formyltransferase [Patescibacteria group bacterium]|nr:methionyl-tRNA formyltransferase [Patescibacteria group bacterium]MBU1922239.1 methionyl-tRNA formyltransferase [Patescibacteria group bacterium]